MADRATLVTGTAILALLAAEPQSLDAICLQVYGRAVRIGSQQRTNVRCALGKLMANGLARRLERPNSTLRNQGPVTFEATDKGRAQHASGKPITSGANGPRTGIPKKSAGMRQRIWTALRMKEKATLPDLVELARGDADPDTGKVTANARKYLMALAAAGIVKVMARREKGFAPSSNGFVRFMLLRDLGPRAPLTGKTFVTDPNADGSDAARIPYCQEDAS